MDKLGMQLDFQGVILLMWGATVPLIYYSFYCDKKFQWLYWSLVRAVPDPIQIIPLDLRIYDSVISVCPSVFIRHISATVQ
jgi:hypothetical protein